MATQLREPQVRGIVRAGEAELRTQRRVTLVFTIAPLLGLGVAIWRLWGNGLSMLDFGLFAGFYIATGLGITVGYHRFFTHRSFRAVRPVRIALGLLGSMAVQGAILQWCATHRRHHAHSDRHGDPHSPHLAEAPGIRGAVNGLLHAHVGWLFSPDHSDPRTWTPDLLDDPDVVRISRRFGTLTFATFALPPLIGFAVAGTFSAALSAFLWGSLARVFLLQHTTFSINSICHFYGRQPYRARDESRNVWPLSALSFGESWHNNHHAFPWSARLGLRAWQVDPGWYLIRGLAAARLVRGVKVPTEKHLSGAQVEEPD